MTIRGIVPNGRQFVKDNGDAVMLVGEDGQTWQGNFIVDSIDIDGTLHWHLDNARPAPKPS